MILVDNLKRVRDEVAKYPQDVTLIAASKTQDKQTVDEFMRIAPDFILGENRVQELVEKYDERYAWHLIGQLQTNKVKYIIDKVKLIHSLDRQSLAEEIEKQAVKHDIVMPCLVEINMGAEITKGGVCPDETLDFIANMANYPHIRVEGIMSVLPNLDDKLELHKLYEQLERIYDDAKCAKMPHTDIKYLSAGMSNDYQIALEHGSNMLRLGRVLFGDRVYNKQEI